MSEIRIHSNMNRIGALMSGIAKGTVKQTVRRSLKRAITSVAKEARTEMRSKKLIKLSAKAMGSRFQKWENTKGDVAQMYAKIRISGTPENLSRFYAKKVAAGKSNLTGARLYGVRVNVLGQTYVVKNGFIHKVGKGAIILARTTSKRYPLQKQKGPSVAEIAQRTGLIQKLSALALERYEKEFDTNLKFYVQRAIDKAKGRSGNV